MIRFLTRDINTDQIDMWAKRPEWDFENKRYIAVKPFSWIGSMDLDGLEEGKIKVL